jgi:uncharacterized membrane protein
VVDVSAGATTYGAYRVLRRAFSRAAPRPEIMLMGAPGTKRIPGRRSEMDYNHVIQRIGEVIDGAGVAIILVGTAIAAGASAVRLGHHETGIYRRFRQQVGQTILLGLELLVAADIVRTVAAEPTLISVAVLGIIVLIRTFLSFSLEVELTGRWPWQKNTTVPPPE